MEQAKTFIAGQPGAEGDAAEEGADAAQPINFMALMSELIKAIQLMNAPKHTRIIRDASGKAQASETVSQTMPGPTTLQ